MSTQMIIGILFAVTILVAIAVTLILLFLSPSKGEEGIKGERGVTGVQGSKGFTGPRGTQPSSGSKGEEGPVGFTGPTGPSGALGDTGIQGPTGWTGLSGEFFVPYLQAQTDTVYDTTPSFSGATGGIGSTIVIGDWESILTTHDSYSVSNTNVTPPTGIQELDVSFTAQSLLDTQNTRLKIFAEDGGGILDESTFLIPPGYIQDYKPYTVPLFIDSTGANFEVKMTNETLIVVGDDDSFDSSDYALHVRELQVGVHKVSS